jgi:hypothetical protein
MFRKLVILVTLISFCPVAAGAQDVAILVKQQASEQMAASEPVPQLNLRAAAEKAEPNVTVAANDMQEAPVADAPRPHKTHTGLTFKEFCDVHFGEYRWVYWVGAVGAIVLLHAFAFSKD